MNYVTSRRTRTVAHGRWWRKQPVLANGRDGRYAWLSGIKNNLHERKHVGGRTAGCQAAAWLGFAGNHMQLARPCTSGNMWCGRWNSHQVGTGVQQHGGVLTPRDGGDAAKTAGLERMGWARNREPQASAQVSSYRAADC